MFMLRIKARKWDFRRIVQNTLKNAAAKKLEKAQIANLLKNWTILKQKFKEVTLLGICFLQF